MPRGTEAVDTVFAVGGCDPSGNRLGEYSFHPMGNLKTAN